jgi:tetratricopeptide (TPR) repeat protein
MTGSGAAFMFGFFGKKPASGEDDLDPNRAVSFFKREDFREALRRADVIVKAKPDVALSWRFRGECLFSLQRHAEAVECFDKAASLGGPGTEDMFLWKSLCLHNGGQPEQAQQVIRDFLASGAGTPQLVSQARNALAQLDSLSA